MRVDGLILAAGAATRFGSAKQLATLDGRPLVRHAVDAQRESGSVDRIVVVIGAHAAPVRAVLPADVTVVVAAGWHEGLGASLRAGLAALADADWVLVTLADQPGITPAAVARVADAIGAGGDALRATYAGRAGHPVALGPALLRRAGELDGDRGFGPLLASADVRSVEVGDVAADSDIDTVADLAAWRESVTSR